MNFALTMASPLLIASGATHYDTWSFEDFASYLSQPLRAPARFVTQIEICHSAYAEATVDADMTADSSACEVTERITLYVDGDRIRHVVSTTDSDGNAAHLVAMWRDGAHAFYWPDERAMIIDSDPVPPNMVDVTLAFNQLYRRMVGTHFWLPLAEHGERRVENVSLTANGLEVTLRVWARHDYAGAVWHMLFAADNDPRLIALDRLTPGLGAKDPVRIEQWRVHSWRDTAEGVVPEHATYTIRWRGPDGQGDETWYQRNLTFRRTSFVLLDPDDVSENWFTLPVEQGIRVANRELQVSYTIGAPHFESGGTLYQLPEAIDDHPRDAIGQLLEQARAVHRPVPPPPSAPAASTSPSRSEPLIRRSIVSGLVIGLIALCALSALRYWRWTHNRRGG
jgi:hypothetical protein